MTINAHVAEAVDEGMRTARRAITEGRHAAEDVRDRTERRVRRQPWRALGVAAIVGFGIGSFAGALAATACGRSRSRW